MLFSGTSVDLSKTDSVTGYDLRTYQSLNGVGVGGGSVVSLAVRTSSVGIGKVLFFSSPSVAPFWLSF